MTRKWTFSGTADLTRNPSEVRVHQQCLLHCLVTSHDTRNHLKVAQTIKAKDMYPERSCVLEGSVIQVPVVYTLDGEANALILHDIGEEHTDLMRFLQEKCQVQGHYGLRWRDSCGALNYAEFVEATQCRSIRDRILKVCIHQAQRQITLIELDASTLSVQNILSLLTKNNQRWTRAT